MSYGEGKRLSSGPWLWMAMRMSNSFTMVSRIFIESGSGLHTMVGTPMSRAYSKARRTSIGSFFIVMLPTLSGVIPAALNFAATALRCSVVLSRGRWKSLIDT